MVSTSAGIVAETFTLTNHCIVNLAFIALAASQMSFGGMFENFPINCSSDLVLPLRLLLFMQVAEK